MSDKIQTMSDERKRGINIGCPACVEGRTHEPLYGPGGEWAYHPNAQQGKVDRGS